MKLIALTALLATACNLASAQDILSTDFKRNLGRRCSRKDGFKKINGICQKQLQITVQNAALNQPFAPFFVMVHTKDAPPIYRQGEPASTQLAELAENGATQSLVDYYKEMHKKEVFYVGSQATETGPLFPGEELKFNVWVTPEYNQISIASMAINTNDCFVAVNSMTAELGKLALPGLDAGSEENNEDCKSIPGPVCANKDSRNIASGNGEGFVHIHRGIQGISDLDSSTDWRNPMAFVTINDA
mmetsp:Transcript_20404/g.37929  ORF Transcript_20404/g.37929 Transcript_20404/m.37929 type:complete len:245 (-) Transcript_20404:47-781(-)